MGSQRVGNHLGTEQQQDNECIRERGNCHCMMLNKKKKVYFFCIQPGHTHENTKRHTYTHKLIIFFLLRGKKYVYMLYYYYYYFFQIGSFCVSLISSRPIKPSLSPTPTPVAFNGAGWAGRRGWTLPQPKD